MVQLTDNSISLGIRGKEIDFLTQVIRLSWAMLFLAILYQLIFFSEITNIMAIAAVVFAWTIATKILLRPQMLETYLLSTFMMLGFTATQFYFPLIFTTLENKPVVYNLELPEQVFLHSTACLLVLAIAHAFYRFLMKATPKRSISLLDKAGFFVPPTHLQLWLMGLVGMASSFYVHLIAYEVGQGVTGDPVDKFIQGLVPFSYAPFFILISKLYGNKQKPHKGFILMIILYTTVLFFISMARNSRSVFIFGLTTPAFAYALGLLIGVFKTRIFSVRNIVVGGFLVWLLLGPFTDLGTAMLIVRGTRQDMPPSELIRRTLEALGDKEAITIRKKDDQDQSMDFDWDERYLNNLFTARFANIKFNDASLITYSKVGEYDPDMQEYSIDQLLAALPDPVLKMFDFDVDKEGILVLSFGDYLYVLSGGYGTPEGYRTGHVAGTGMATFGWWYLLLLGLVAIPIFYLNDKFFRAKEHSPASVDQAPEEKFRFSFCGVLALTAFFQFFLFESVIQGVIYLMRGWIQIVILYFVMFHLTRIVGAIISGRIRQKDLNSNG